MKEAVEMETSSSRRERMQTHRWALALIIMTNACDKPESPKTTSSATAQTTATASASAAAANAPATFAEHAKQVVNLLVAKKYGEVHKQFDDAMKKAVTDADAVGTMWSTIEKTVGPYKRTIGTTESEKGGYLAVNVTCEFEQGPLDIRVVFDKERRISGFFSRPTTNPEAYGPRPQTPKPPFAYDAREVAYDNAKDTTRLTGTLTLPKGAGPFPAVLLITGSGTQDRDETLFGHKPFLVIADQLTKKGVAVLRVDDPGAGGSTGDVQNATVEKHARDAEAGIAFLKAQKEIDPKRIGLIGHSEGGIIAAVVAASSKEVAFVVSLAGTGVSGAELNPMQIEAILRAQGKMKDDGIKAIVDAQRKLMKLIAKDAKDADIEAALKEAFDAAAAHAPGSDAEKEEAQKQLAASVQPLKTPWFKSFVKLDPAVHWGKVTVPVLAMIGDKDTQVPADTNLDAIKGALKKANNKDITTTKLAGLNHLFQPATTGLLDEYAKIETTFDPKALDLLTEWVNKHTTAK
jgi:dienelactone hydrolase